MWKKEKSVTAGGDFEAVAARVTAEVEQSELPGADSAGAPEALIIRPEWANAAARLCFLPAAKFSHPAFALTDEEAEKITPQIQALLQAVSDRYAPALLGHMANKHRELFDAVAALGVLYWQKWRLVSHLRKVEAMERARMAAEAQQPKERAEAEAFAASAVASADVPQSGEAEASEKPPLRVI